MFRWTLALILMLMGGALIGNAFLFYPSLTALPRRLVAALIGALVFGGGILLIKRRHAGEVEASRHKSVWIALQDGFTTFGLASLGFNTLMMILGKCDLDPTFDVLHLIPAIVMNEIWEGLISASGRSFFLTAGGIALFDASIGAIIGLLFAPLRQFLPRRMIWVAVALVCFTAFEAVVIRWMAFRC